MSGIYAIEHVASGRIYIGASVNIPRRWKRHMNDLDAGLHRNAVLQAAWVQFGRDAFRFYVLERCERAVLQRREQEWISGLEAAVTGFNQSPTAGWHPHTDQSRARVSAALRGRTCTPEHRAAVSRANKGRLFSIAHRLALKAARARQQVTEETRRKLRTNALCRLRENGHFAGESQGRPHDEVTAAM